MIHPEMNIIYLIAVLSLVFFTVCVCGVCLCLCSKDKPTNVRHQRRANHTNTTNNDHNQYPATIFDHSCHPIIINNFLHYPDMNYDVKPFNNFETPPPSYLEVTGGNNQDSRHTHQNCDSGVCSHNDGLHGPCSSRGDDTRGTDGGGTCDTGDSGGCDTGRGDGGGCDTGGGDSGCCDSGGGDGGGCDSGGTD